MTEYLAVEGGRIAYEVAGEGPLVVLSHGIGDRRQTFRHLSAALVKAGYRVVSTDLRGHGDSEITFSSYKRTDTANDLLALVRHLGSGPAVLIGQSFGAGAATVAAADSPEDIVAIVQIGPGVRAPKIRLRDVNGRFVKGIALLAMAALLRSLGFWRRYLDFAYPGVRMADHDAELTALMAKMGEPGRMKVFSTMMTGSSADSAAALARVQVPALVIMGTMDPDFPNPRAEAEDLARVLPHGEVSLIEGAGHYPHAQYPAETAEAVLGFLKAHAVA
ncbi:pimeloyl-ACP methyl ester carboxylesterase [Actinocorallia herbida]|uniref:Pimeloyl-ACP methyl ester carboxylesterase n=1 Tax=Actinocorallia herbida TaxID=58109 RepID=A0A3N1CPL2_9ACTN|nr:alpha/beta hydrolase [Actinocorallia herbida]ROO83104.1 pimeloyl-ACP methyl ester carboxylesterase [Actinocorallia herbida]